MTTIQVPASKAYNIHIASGLLEQVGDHTASLFPDRTAAVVTDTNVAALYLPAVLQSLKQAGLNTLSFVFPAGEHSKAAATYLELVEFLAEHHLTRSDVLIALGGGVVGDLTGFAAATYLRGVHLIQRPTTLLAAVDSSVGGKTAIDLTGGKNLVGAFYQPDLVLCDPDTLQTLSQDQFSDGAAEVIKYGMLGSQTLLGMLAQAPISQQLEQVIALCVGLKRDIVLEDEFDTGRRQLLNLGHTVGHAVESCSQYAISHGRAVAIGLCIITRAAVKKGICSESCCYLLETLLEQYALPQKTSFGAQELYEKCLSDKKRSGGQITLVVPTSMGKSELFPMPVEELKNWIEMGIAP